MDDKYSIKKIDHTNIDKILRLYTACFERLADVNFFRWKYFDNPNGEALCLGFRYNDNIVASCVMIPEEFYIFGERIKIYKCCDLMVDPEHRKQGLSTRLIFSLVESLGVSGYEFLYTLCSKNATRSFLKNHWIKLGNVYSYFKHKSQLNAKFLFNKFERFYDKGILRQVDSISDLCDAYKFKLDKTKIHIAKNEAYFKWRLNDPRYRYNIIGYYENGFLAGYIIYNIGINNIIYIIDIESHEDNPGIIRALLSASELAGYKSNSRLVIALAINNTVFQKAVKRNGYIRNSFPRGPLKSRLDFNISIDKSYAKDAFNELSWDIYPLSYDDI